MKRLLLLVLAMLLASSVFLHYQKLDVYLWQHWKLNRQSLPEQAMNLGRYRADIQALPLQGVEDDLSALAYNPERNTLFGLINGTPLLLEISLEGEVLRTVRIEGVKDMEGLAHIGANRYVIVEERHQRLRIIELPDDVATLDATDAPRLTLAIDDKGNKAYEGLSWDTNKQRLLVVRERDPMRLLSIEGFVDGNSASPQIDINEKSMFEEHRLFLSDLSAVEIDNHSGHLLLLSDESRMLVEYSAEGQPLSVLGLRRGFHGLERTVPQAEGLAIDGQRRIYLVSEPNLFYRFVPIDTPQSRLTLNAMPTR